MGLSLVHSRALLGLDAKPVQVEVHLANGLPSFTLVGLADTEVKEARERVRSAIANAGWSFPATSASPSTWRRPTCPRTRAASTCRSRWASWRPAARSTPRGWTGWEFAGELSAWAANCARCAARWP